MAFQHILLPVDSSDRHAAAAAAARDLIAPGGRVTVLHVIETLDLPYEEIESFYRQLEDRAETRMASVAALLKDADCTVVRHIRYGKRAGEIIRFSQAERADLIVMTSHREDPDDAVRRFLTISHQVAILAPVPVLLVR